MDDQNEVIELRHPNVDGTCWARRSALGQMDPGWEPVPEVEPITEPPSSVPDDPETEQEGND